MLELPGKMKAERSPHENPFSFGATGGQDQAKKKAKKVAKKAGDVWGMFE